MKVVGPAGEMPWEFCGRVTYTLAGRNQSGNRNIPFSQFCSFPPSLQEISQFAGSREIGEVGGKGLLNTETPHSAQAVLELWEAEAGGDPGDCILHPSHGISAWLCWVLGGLDLFSGPVQPLSCSPQLLQAGRQGWGWVVFTTRSKKTVIHLHLQQVLQRLTLVHNILRRMETIIFVLECGLKAFIFLYFFN